MDVLNQNQRNSAIWRLIGLGVLVVGAVGVMLYSMHNTYASQGLGELEEVKKNCKDALEKCLGNNADLKVRINKISKELNDLKKEQSKPDETVKILKERIDERKDRIRDLEEDLKRCENKLQISSNTQY